MSGIFTEEVEVLLKAVLSLLLSELAIFSKLGGEIRVGFFLVSIATARVSITGVTGVAGVALSAIIVFILVGILSGVVVCIALSLIIRAFVLVGSQIFSGHLRMALPVICRISLKDVMTKYSYIMSLFVLCLSIRKVYACD